MFIFSIHTFCQKFRHEVQKFVKQSDVTKEIFNICIVLKNEFKAKQIILIKWQMRDF